MELGLQMLAKKKKEEKDRWPLGSVQQSGATYQLESVIINTKMT